MTNLIKVFLIFFFKRDNFNIIKKGDEKMSETTTIKFAKIKNTEGVYGDAIPIGVDAVNVDIDGKGNLQRFVEDI